MKNANKSAYPFCGMDTTSGSASDGDTFIKESGLTKREYFAAMAMQGLIGQEYKHGEHELIISETIARRSLRAADELLKQLGE